VEAAELIMKKEREDEEQNEIRAENLIGIVVSEGRKENAVLLGDQWRSATLRSWLWSWRAN